MSSQYERNSYITEEMHQGNCDALEMLALRGSDTTPRRAAQIILALIAAKKPDVDLSGICFNFDDKNFALVMNVILGFRQYGWFCDSCLGPIDLIDNLVNIHDIQLRSLPKPV